MQVTNFNLNRDNIGIVFKNLHFETHFQKFAFSDPQNATVV